MNKELRKQFQDDKENHQVPFDVNHRGGIKEVEEDVEMNGSRKK